MEQQNVVVGVNLTVQVGGCKVLAQDFVETWEGETCEALLESKVQDSEAQILHAETTPKQGFVPLSKAFHPPNLPIKVHVHGTSQSTWAQHSQFVSIVHSTSGIEYQQHIKNNNKNVLKLKCFRAS